MCYDTQKPPCCRRPILADASNAGEKLAEYGRRILVLYGSAPAGDWREAVRNSLAGAGFRLSEMSGAEPEPLRESVAVGASICRQERIDAILALGGGVVLDFARDVRDAFRAQNPLGRQIALVYIPSES